MKVFWLCLKHLTEGGDGRLIWGKHVCVDAPGEEEEIRRTNYC